MIFILYSNNIYSMKILKYMCGPRISAHAFPTRWRAQFLFKKNDLLIKNDLESPLIFFFFLKGQTK